MAITTQQELVDTFFPDENKSIDDLVNHLYDLQKGLYTKEEIKTELKDKITNVSDWSI
tara:strand:+ start:226 stop:399 length:174 start_codon:yes stop_codon:yes gene_type:complete